MFIAFNPLKKIVFILKYCTYILICGSAVLSFNRVENICSLLISQFAYTKKIQYYKALLHM